MIILNYSWMSRPYMKRSLIHYSALSSSCKASVWQSSVNTENQLYLMFPANGHSFKIFKRYYSANSAQRHSGQQSEEAHDDKNIGVFKSFLNRVRVYAGLSPKLGTHGHNVNESTNERSAKVAIKVDNDFKIGALETNAQNNEKHIRIRNQKRIQSLNMKSDGTAKNPIMREEIIAPDPNVFKIDQIVASMKKQKKFLLKKNSDSKPVKSKVVDIDRSADKKLELSSTDTPIKFKTDLKLEKVTPNINDRDCKSDDNLFKHNTVIPGTDVNSVKDVIGDTIDNAQRKSSTGKEQVAAKENTKKNVAVKSISKLEKLTQKKADCAALKNDRESEGGYNNSLVNESSSLTNELNLLLRDLASNTKSDKSSKAKKCNSTATRKISHVPKKNANHSIALFPKGADIRQAAVEKNTKEINVDVDSKGKPSTTQGKKRKSVNSNTKINPVKVETGVIIDNTQRKASSSKKQVAVEENTNKNVAVSKSKPSTTQGKKGKFNDNSSGNNFTKINPVKVERDAIDNTHRRPSVSNVKVKEDDIIVQVKKLNTLLDKNKANEAVALMTKMIEEGQEINDDLQNKMFIVLQNNLKK
eukprot:Awhi_evm1s13312